MRRWPGAASAPPPLAVAAAVGAAIASLESDGEFLSSPRCIQGSSEGSKSAYSHCVLGEPIFIYPVMLALFPPIHRPNKCQPSLLLFDMPVSRVSPPPLPPPPSSVAGWPPPPPPGGLNAGRGANLTAEGAKDADACIGG